MLGRSTAIARAAAIVMTAKTTAEIERHEGGRNLLILSQLFIKNVSTTAWSTR
jgi:hypothetical protein